MCPGAKARFVAALIVQAKAWTYLRSNGKGKYYSIDLGVAWLGEDNPPLRQAQGRLVPMRLERMGLPGLWWVEKGGRLLPQTMPTLATIKLSRRWGTHVSGYRG